MWEHLLGSRASPGESNPGVLFVGKIDAARVLPGRGKLCGVSWDWNGALAVLLLICPGALNIFMFGQLLLLTNS